MKNLMIEQGTLAKVLERAVANKELVVCDRCEVAVLAEDMFGTVCSDCAHDLITDGLAREEEQMAEDLVEELLEELAEAIAVQDAYEKMVSYGVPIGAVDLDFFL